MPTRTASAQWLGTLTQGNGTMALGSGAFSGPYSFKSRFEDGPGTNPEELLAAAYAGCFSMFLSKVLAEAGRQPNSIKTEAKLTGESVHGAFTLTKVELTTAVNADGVDADELQKHAETAKANCPVSRALNIPERIVTASLA
jgi:osmotically inducible protein OsmC